MATSQIFPKDAAKPVPATLLEIKNLVQARARELGFIACGITDAAPLQGHTRYLSWLEHGYDAAMRYLRREDAVWKRADVRRIMPEAQSVICVAMPYLTEEEWDEKRSGKVARYARGRDYHDFLTPRLRELGAYLEELAPCQTRSYCDTGPVLERELAQRAGLGWIGKNTLLMSREFGSFVMLGEILCSLPLPPDAPHVAQFCGSCTRCLDACPTNAFTSPGVLDANKCISYHTIESRAHLPAGLREQFGDWFFGCDVCQEVCPWNAKSAVFSEEPELWSRSGLGNGAPPSLLEMVMMPPEEFARAWKNSPLKRSKRRGLKRNALNVLRNRKR
jgi:epoxyqueuosine reductase